MKEEQLIAEVLYGEETADRSRYALYENGTYMVISKFAYLIGVPFHIFENEHEPPKMEWYEALEKDKNARIIRNLCMLRTAFERNYRNIYQAMRYDLKGIASMPEYIPRECIDQLSADGLSIYRANAQPIQYIIDINSHIANRINNCKNLFPIWLNWSYIRQLFIMPGGTTEKGAKGAAADYYAHKEIYPYQVYMNWSAPSNVGNILYNDKKFVRLLYEHHEDYFTDMSKVTDAGLIITAIREDGEGEPTIHIRLLDGREFEYSADMLEKVDLSYCISIHKSQGAEFPVVIIPILKEHYIMLRRNLLYTAISRAKVKVILIGQKQAVFMAIHKSDVDKRNTILSDRIVAYYAREKQNLVG